MNDIIDNKCIICDKSFTVDPDKPIATAKQRALKRLLACSLARKDGKEELFRNKSEILLHKNCQTKYICDKSISAYLKKSQAKPISQSSKSDKTKKPKSIKPVIEDEPESDCDESVFNPDKCIFCFKYADKEFVESQQKLPPHKRIAAVVQVTKTQTQENILKMAAKYNDYLSQQVLLRIANVDLVEAKAVYHRCCYKTFFTVPTGKKRGNHRIYVDIDEESKQNQATKNVITSECKARWDKLHNDIKKEIRKRWLLVKRKNISTQNHDEQSPLKPDSNNSSMHDSIKEEDPLDMDMYEESIEDHIPDSPNLSISPASSIKRDDSPTNTHVMDEIFEFEDPLTTLNKQKQDKLEEVFENGDSDQKLDDLDHFFLKLSKVVKKLPKLHQSRLKKDLQRAVDNYTARAKDKYDDF